MFGNPDEPPHYSVKDGLFTLASFAVVILAFVVGLMGLMKWHGI